MAEESQGHGIVLPQPGKRNILITSALPYVNNVPHLGNIIGSVLSADASARFTRGRGLNTLYIGGTNEYGTTTEARALVEQCTPQELCDKYHAVYAEIYEWFNISFDIFGRTTTKLQTDITQDIFLKLNGNGYLSEQMTTQLYCPQHCSFLADRFVEGECPACGYADARGDQCDLCGRLLEPLDLKSPRCKLDGFPPVTKETKHVFLELDKLQPGIERFFREATADGGWSANGKSITSAWLKEGLQPRSITHDIKWGTAVPLPGYEEKVIYSWFDACIGYVSITARYTDEWEKWWRNPQDVQLYQFLGKDNVVFHSVIFPATQIGTGDTWTMLRYLSTTDYLTYEGGKFSKSRGVGVFRDSAQKTGVPSDIWRFFLLYHRPETGDSEFTWDTFISANNNLLLKNLAVKLRAGLLTVLLISQQGNSFLQANKLSNALCEEEPSKCAAVVGLAINLVHLIASVIAPFMPETAKMINAQLCASPLPILDHWDADSIPPGHEISKAEHLFSRIPPEKAQEWRTMFGSEEAKKLKEEEAAIKARKKAERAPKAK
ncbi:hypothetical protein NPX13_g9304 [Xylaria arbuscula]|uniref:methionine--tRNA ligase n=1 Tax=Xylaria arbuscula TaxID=114810 RepID=A0A9W8THU3_9PEZI|nr:hypothetical protein NPX13_g9304 [Xylaria arbuscula]